MIFQTELNPKSHRKFVEEHEKNKQEFLRES
jgi:hypothetical protein